MNFLKYIVLSLTLLHSNLYAQYDAGTIIRSENINSFYDLVVKKYIVVDFNGDYYFDIVMINDGNPNQLTWFKGNENGDFSIQDNLLDIGDNYRENEIFYADMNGDAIKDIVFQNNKTGFTVLLNDGQGNISAQIYNEVTPNNTEGISLKEIADVDGDGDMDGIFWIEKFDPLYSEIAGNCTIGYNSGDGTFSDYSNLDNNIEGMALVIEAADIEGDGDLDIMCSGFYCCNSPFVWFYENTGSNNFTKKVIESPWVSHIRNVKIIDIDMDGSQELLIEYVVHIIICHYENCYTDQLHILDYDIENKEFTTLEVYDSWFHEYIPQESSFESSEIYDNAFQMQFADQNNDGNLDILSINVPQDKLQWYLGDGNGNFDTTLPVTFREEFRSSLPVLRAVDIDYDTDLDIFVLLNSRSENTLVLYENLALSPVCSPFLDLEDTPLVTGVYQAGMAITASGSIVAGNAVVLKAGNNIKLQKGFEIPANSNVSVGVGLCN